MQQQEGFKRFLPHLLIIAIFIAISCAFCYPAFQNKTLDQHDMKTWLWASKESRDYHEKTGESALWANNMFGGMPQVQVDSYAENNWYNKLNQLLQLYTHGQAPNPATFFFIAMGCFYILMCTLRINKWLGAIGAVAFAFSAYNPTIITAGHTTKMLDIAFLPAIMAGVIMAYRGKYFAGAALAGLFLAFAFDAGHLQIIYYSVFLITAMVLAALVSAFKTKTLKTWSIASVLLLMAAGFAFLTSASRLIQTEEYVPYSSRGGSSELTIGKKEKTSGLDRDYAFSWSNGVGEALLTPLVPNLYGGSIKENIGEDSHFGKKLSELGASQDGIEQMTRRAPLYWGPQPLITGTAYFGAVICFLFVLSLFVIRSRYKWWLAGATLFILCVSMGKNFATFNYFMFDHFPLFNKFRSPNMASAIASVVVPMMGIWALKDIFGEKITKADLFKKLKLSLIITGGLCVLILIATQTAMDFKAARDEQMAQQYGQPGPDLIKALREDRSSAASSDALRSLIFVLLAGGVLYAYSKDKVNKNTAIAALGLLVVVDIIPVAHRWLNSNDFVDTEQYQADNFQPSPADAQILQDKDPYYRVFDLSSGDPFSDSKPSYFHKSVGGYHGAKMQSYVDMIEHQIGKLNVSVLNMLNTKYFILPGQQNHPPAVQQNPGALGNAWFVSDVKWVKTADEEMLALNAPSLQTPMDTAQGNFNPAQTAILRDTFKTVMGNYAFGKDSMASIKLAPGGYGPRRLKFESSNAKDGLAVFSDVYYPIGWTAAVDGKPTPILRTDYILRAIKVPAGKHTITFEFDSAAYEKGKSLALIGSILLTLLIAAGLFFTFKPAKTTGQVAA